MKAENFGGPSVGLIGSVVTSLPQNIVFRVCVTTTGIRGCGLVITPFSGYHAKGYHAQRGYHARGYHAHINMLCLPATRREVHHTRATTFVSRSCVFVFLLVERTWSVYRASPGAGMFVGSACFLQFAQVVRTRYVLTSHGCGSWPSLFLVSLCFAWSSFAGRGYTQNAQFCLLWDRQFFREVWGTFIRA